jgi:hypothetical protein
VDVVEEDQVEGVVVERDTPREAVAVAKSQLPLQLPQPHLPHLRV